MDKLEGKEDLQERKLRSLGGTPPWRGLGHHENTKKRLSVKTLYVSWGF